MPMPPPPPASPPKKPPSGGDKKPASGGKEDKTATPTKVSNAIKQREAEEQKKKAAMAQLEREMAEELNITPPTLADNIAVSIFKLPLTVTSSTLWLLSGGMSAPDYKTRRALGLSAAEFAAYSEEEQAELVESELWVPDNLAAYEAQFAESDRGKAKTGKQKREARALKKAAGNKMAVLPDND